MFGHNDVFNQVGSKNYQHYLENSLKVLISAGFKQIWLLSPNQVLGLTKTKLYPPYLKKLRQLATDHQVDFINIWSEAFKKQDLSQIYTYRFDYAGLSGIDYLHPNEKGHRLIAKFLTQHFSNHLKR
jgi:lysophospholipase L1-like esterase